VVNTNGDLIGAVDESIGGNNNAVDQFTLFKSLPFGLFSCDIVQAEHKAAKSYVDGTISHGEEACQQAFFGDDGGKVISHLEIVLACCPPLRPSPPSTSTPQSWSSPPLSPPQSSPLLPTPPPSTPPFTPDIEVEAQESPDTQTLAPPSAPPSPLPALPPTPPHLSPPPPMPPHFPPPFAPPPKLPPFPPPFAPFLTCETLLASGKNLRDEGKWCVDLKTAEECGTLNYVPNTGHFKQCGFKNGQCLARHGELSCLFPSPPSPPSVAPPPTPPPFPPPFAPGMDTVTTVTCETLLTSGKNLQEEGKWCVDLKTAEQCGTLNYIHNSGQFKQCGFKNGQCLAKHGELSCPFPSTPSPSPPPVALLVGSLACETLLATGTNLRDEGLWCSDLKTEEECGTLNYVPTSNAFKQCGFKSGKCLTKYGELSCPFPQQPSPRP
jgi:hypothetical protein